MQSRSAPNLSRMIGRKIRSLAGIYRASDAWPQGVVSFTFDDFPKSALTAGGSILERHGARGTYYVASKLAKTDGAVGRLFDVEDISAAHHNGHEIGCHTYTHLKMFGSGKIIHDSRGARQCGRPFLDDQGLCPEKFRLSVWRGLAVGQTRAQALFLVLSRNSAGHQ